MTNQQISKILQQIADMLELKDAIVFEVRAYQQAARAIEYLGEEVVDIYRRGGVKALNEIPGVGASIADHIRELFETGALKKYDKLRKQIPEVELQILDIPGVGPKTAKKLYETLKPKSKDDLEKFLKMVLTSLESRIKNKELRIKPSLAHKIRQLQNLNLQEKSLENVLRGIEILKRQTGRMLISVAYPIAMQVLEAIKKFPELKRADVVGSLRRMKETIGDIDIVASLQTQKSNVKTQKAIDVIKKFTSLPFVKEVISKGDTKATIIHQDGAQIDLEILPSERYGSLLQHFTGSKEHNVALRTWGVEHGFSISEHGIKKLKTQSSKLKAQNGKLITCDTEEKVYKTLGMDWIPPELRENRGEIAAAQKYQLPKLVELKDIKGDFHVHSNISLDGHDSVEALAKRAIEKKYQYLCISDHTKGLGVAGGLDEKKIFTQRKKFDQLNQESRTRLPDGQVKNHSFKILLGVEVNIKIDGSLDIADEALSVCDVVIASTHSSFHQETRTATQRYLKAITNKNVDIIGHPTGRLIGKREELKVDWPTIFQACKENQVALEIDSLTDRLDLKDSLVFEARRYDLKFAIDTDSHRLEHLDSMYLGVSVARRGWLTKADVLNTMELNDLMQWLRK